MSGCGRGHSVRGEHGACDGHGHGRGRGRRRRRGLIDAGAAGAISGCDDVHRRSVPDRAGPSDPRRKTVPRPLHQIIALLSVSPA